MRRESRRQQILQAALACFSEDGFHQTGMADIVRRSGMSHGAVYGYFQSKDEIIEALADDRHEGEAIVNSTAQRIEDPIEGLRELVRAYANGLIDPAGSQRRRVAVHGWGGGAAESARSRPDRRGDQHPAVPDRRAGRAGPVHRAIVERPQCRCGRAVLCRPVPGLRPAGRVG